MIWRYVQLRFAEGCVDEFLSLYSEVEASIRNQPGCLSLMLLKETGDPTTYITWSVWQDRRDLQLYRRSDFFKGFWPQVKAMLREPAVAASYEAAELPFRS